MTAARSVPAFRAHATLSSFRRPTGLGGLLFLSAGLMLLAAGCSKASKPRSSEAAPAAAKAEEKAEAPAEEPPLKLAQPKKAPAKPAAPPPVEIVQKDPTKWDTADLQTGLTTHDPRFVPAVLIFSMQNMNGAKQAEELRGLAEKAGQMKDDLTVPLALPTAPLVTPVSASKPVVPGSVVTPPGRGMRRPGRGGVRPGGE
jgi:hypothetical protein